MIKKNYLFIVSALCIMITHQAYAGGALVVTQNRIVIEGKKRTASVSVSNPGDSKGSYKAEFINVITDEKGSATFIEPGESIPANLQPAERYIRLSPRRFTLNPGEYQNIRLLVRVPKDFKDGEYRSHLRVTLLPEETILTEEVEEELEGKQYTTVGAQSILSYTIPIILRRGNLSVEASISDIQLKPAEGDKKPHVTFKMNRTGDKSLYGDLRILYTTKSGKEYTAKYMGGTATYTPNSHRLYDIVLNLPEGVTVDGGSIDIIYSEKPSKENPDEEGKLITKARITL